MTLLADSGSTKTTWVEVETGRRTTTHGLNPHFVSDEAFAAACYLVRQALCSQPDGVRFYGAGCGSAMQRERVERLLTKVFGTADVKVDTDMLLACQATCHDTEGMVAVLGTGSNSCYYDGHAIAYQPFSTGYILGDKGSGNHVGRLLLDDYLSRRMPAALQEAFARYFDVDDEALFNMVYHSEQPNRFLASLAPFAVRYIRMPYCQRIVKHALGEWYSAQIAPLLSHGGRACGTVHVVGGFGKAIEPLLRKTVEGRGLRVGNVFAEPLEAPAGAFTSLKYNT